MQRKGRNSSYKGWQGTNIENHKNVNEMDDKIINGEYKWRYKTNK
jgi:hypothetical protein